MIIIGIILGLFFLLLLALPYLLDLNRYRDQYSPVIERVLNRKVAIPHVRLMWFPHLGVRLENPKIFDDPEVSQAPFVQVSSIELAVKWKPLLQRRIEVQSLTLHQPLISLIRTKEGILNTASLGGQQQQGHETPRPEETSTSMLAMFGVEQVHLSEGTVRFEDRTLESGKIYSLESFELKTESVRLGDTAKFSARGILTPSQHPVSLEGSLGPLQENLEIAQIETTLNVGSSYILAKGQAKGGRMHLDITSSLISLNDFPLNLRITKPVELTEVFAHVQAPFSGGNTSHSNSLPVSISPFRFHVKMGETTLRVTGRAVGSRVEIHGTAPVIHSEDLPISLPLQNPISLNKLDMKVRTDGVLVEMEVLTGEIFHGHFSGHGIWDGRSAVPAFRSTGSIQEFHVEEVQQILRPASVALNGTGILNWDLRGTLPSRALPLLFGKTDLSIVKGQLIGFDLFHQIEEILKLEGVLSGEQGFTKFSKLQAEVEFKGEHIPIKSLLLEGQENDFSMNGSGVVMRDQSMNVKGNLRLGNKMSEQIIRRLPVATVALQEGELAVPFVVKGSLAEPEVDFDFAPIQKRLQKEVGKTVQKILQGDPKDVQEILKSGKSLFKQLFGK